MRIRKGIKDMPIGNDGKCNKNTQILITLKRVNKIWNGTSYMLKEVAVGAPSNIVVMKNLC